jgi:hypothetical protein
MVSMTAAQVTYSISKADPVPRYDLTIQVLPDAHRLEATGTMQLSATGAQRESLKLALSELMVDFRVEVLQPLTSAGPAKIEKKERPWAGAPGWGTNEYTIRPTRPIPAGEAVLLKFSYAGESEKSSFVFYLGPEASFGAGTSTAWYPEAEESTSDEGDRLRGIKGVGVLNFSVPAGYTVIASGSERSAEQEVSQGRFRFEIDQPTSFSFAAGRYSVLRRKGTVPMAAYVLHPRQNIEKYLDGSSRILDVLVREFGPSPYGKFALVEVPDEQAGNAGFNGASQEGLILTSSSSLDAEFNPNHYGHEISHQWWGNLIRNKGPHGYLMLDEAMAQYGALVSIEELEGSDAAARFRRRGDPAFGIEQSGLAFLAIAAAGLDHKLLDLPSQRNSLYISNSKGFLVYDLLSRTIGREKFRQILHGFVHEHAFQRVTLEEFLAAIEKGARTNLTWFYKQWFERTGAPDWRMTWKQEGATLSGIITQSPPYYQATVEIQAKSSDCQQITRTVDIRGPRTEFALPVKFQVKEVILDPDFKVLHWTPEYRAEATALAPYWQGLVKWQDGKSAEAQQIISTALAQVPVPDLYAVRFMLEEGLARVLQGDKSLSKEKKFSEMKIHLEKALASPVRRPDRLPWVYYFLATVAKQLNDQATLRWAVEGAITSDAALGGHTGWASAARALLPND